MRINGGSYSSVTSGSPSSVLALAATGSASTIDLLVTAADGITTTNYTITIYRATVPSPPAYVSAYGTGINRQVTLSWTASPGATSYTGQISTGSTVCVTTALTCSFTSTIAPTNLANGTSYTFRVFASGSATTSATSTSSNAATPDNALPATPTKAIIVTQPQGPTNGVPFAIQPWIVLTNSTSLTTGSTGLTVTASITAGGCDSRALIGLNLLLGS